MSKDLVKGRKTRQIRVYEDEWYRLKHMQIARELPFADMVAEALQQSWAKHQKKQAKEGGYQASYDTFRAARS